MLKTRIWLNNKRGLLLIVAALAAEVGALFGAPVHAYGFFDGH
jgi:hypothetical protein